MDCTFCRTRHPYAQLTNNLLVWFTLVISFLAWGSSLNAEPLSAEKAFKVVAKADASTKTIQLHWQLAPGYYLYQESLGIDSESPGLVLGALELPAATLKDDPFLGQQKIHEENFTALVPILSLDNLSKSILISVRAQGCAVSGYCYPPFTRQLELPVASLTNFSQSIPTSVNQLFNGQRSTQEPLPEEQAFAFSLKRESKNTVRLHWDVVPGYHLYRDKFSFAVEGNNTVDIINTEYPITARLDDPILGLTEVYSQPLDVVLTLENADESFQLKVGYQGCAESGFCYPPISKLISFEKWAGATDKTSQIKNASEEDKLVKLLSSEKTWFILLTFFALGLGLAFTPCVLPMLPILASIIAGEGKELTTLKAFLFSFIYVLFMALTYAGAGVVAAMAGHNLQAIFQSWWAISGFSIVFILLALAMFGFYELQLPSKVRHVLSDWHGRFSGGTYIESAIMGFLSSLIVSPCLTPALAGSLIFISDTGDAFIGGSALFAMGLGMGVPLIIVGTFEGAILPKAGAWMETVKQVFGVVLILMAIWMLDRIVPGQVTLGLLALVLMTVSIFMGAFSPVSEVGPHPGWGKLWKGLGLFTFVLGVILALGSAMGNTNPMRPLANINFTTHNEHAGGIQPEQTAFNPVIVKTYRQFRQMREEAQSVGQPLFIDFYAKWCASCNKMEKTVFSNAKVLSALSQYRLIKVDVTENNDDDKALMQALGVFAPPTFLIISPEDTGNGRRLVGYVGAEDFIRWLQSTD